MTLNVGDRIGDYEIVSVLGAGGMGKVYKVRNVISDRVEAMKILLPNLESDPDLADRFTREIKVQGSLDHPNIAGLHTAQRLNNQLVMIMEYVEGVTIEQQLHAGLIPIEKGIEYISQVLSALSYAHARGVIHRDIKPANMMLTTTGVVKLMDFGIAKLSADPKLTQTGRTVGSLYYMSPEQINGVNLDARSDLYSLGVSLYEIVTGTRPFKGDSDFSIMAAHLNSTPVSPVQLDPKLPAMLNEIIMMSLARDPAQRFQSADAFRNALQSLAASLGSPALQQAAPAPMKTAPTMAAAPVPAVQPVKSRRGLYMALGSLATVAVVVLAAIQAPKWFQPSGASAPSQAPIAAAPQSPPTQNQPAQIPQAPAEPVAQQPVTPTAAPSPVAATPRTAPERRQDTVAPRLTQAAVPPATRPALAVAQAPQQMPVQSAQPAATQVSPEPPKVDQAKAAALHEHRELLMLLGTRANSIKGSLQTLQQQQARSGLNLRADMVTAQQRMEFYLDEADSSFKSGDPAKMKKNLDSAEREIEKLEKFLGH
jgi:serine/threonine-protein kinase